jgi:uncharacterized repeat protein (TIGR04138 family)
MSTESVNNLEDLVAKVGRYPVEAFLFVRDGLNHAVERIHGEESRAHRFLARYCAQHDLDWSELIARYHAHELNESLVQAIDAAGGSDKLNRHVGGREMCWGLRDLAIERWGLMARVVLESWSIRATADFGQIVFAFIEHEMMQKQEGDSIQDFEEVYDFKEVFSRTFQLESRSDDAPADEN